MRKNGNVVLIAPREELAAKEKQQLENARRSATSSRCTPSRSSSTTPRRRTSSTSSRSDKDQRRRHRAAARARSSRARTAIVDPRTNILFVTDTAARLEEVRRMIRQIDVPVRQVLIEARIVIADDTFGRQLGVRFGADGVHLQQPPLRVGSGGSPVTHPVSHGRRAHHPRDAHADAVRAPRARIRRLLRLAATQREPAGGRRRRPARADADQPRQRQPGQPRALRARGRQPRQGGVEPARHHGRQPEGAHRAGHGDPLRHARQRQFARDGVVQEGRAAARRSRRRSRRTTASS